MSDLNMNLTRMLTILQQQVAALEQRINTLERSQFTQSTADSLYATKEEASTARIKSIIDSMGLS